MTLPILNQITHAFDERASSIPCTAGCSACCHGPFDISPADAALIAEGLQQLDAAARGAIVSRARDQLHAYTSVVADWHAPWDVDALSEMEFDRLCEQLSRLPCPALDDTGRCSVYAYRPVTCRLMGMPWQGSDGAVLENTCPIQDRFDGYRHMTPIEIDLESIECLADQRDHVAMAKGWCRTTIAGAIASG